MKDLESPHFVSHRTPINRINRLGSVGGMTLLEVMIAAIVLTMVVLGVLQASLQGRRMTEGSVRQASVASLVQGYLEQMKAFKYGNLQSSPATTPGAGSAVDWPAENTVVLKDATQNPVPFYLAAGTAPVSLPAISSLPTDASMHVESVEIDNVNSTSTLTMWIWINDMTGGSVANCKSIVIVYQWTVKDGGRVQAYSDMMRSIRSAVPTN